MTFFEYIAVLVSIIVALGIAQILFGFARTIEKPEGQKIYWVHLLWAAWLFLSLIFFWWWEFQLGALEVWTFNAYLVVVLYATTLFLLTALLFPTREHNGIDFEERFFSRRNWFFGMMVLSMLIDVFDTALKGGGHLGDLGGRYLIELGLGASFCFGGMMTRAC